MLRGLFRQLSLHGWRGALASGAWPLPTAVGTCSTAWHGLLLCCMVNIKYQQRRRQRTSKDLQRHDLFITGKPGGPLGTGSRLLALQT